MHRSSRKLTFISLLIIAMALLPVVYLVIRAAGAGADEWKVFLRPRVWKVLGNSALLALITTTGSIAIGVPLAFLTTHTDLPLRRFWSVVSVLPLAFPSYILAYAYIALLGTPIYGLAGTALVITLINYPFVLLMTRATLHRMDPSLEEAAMGLGCSRRKVFWRVTLPQLRPSIVSGSLLVSLYTLSDFGSPALMQFNTFTRVIYTQYKASFNRNAAALTALVLVLLTILILASESLTRGKGRMHRSSSVAQRPVPTFHLGRWRWPAFAFCSLIATAALFLPIAELIHRTSVGLSHGQPLHLPWAAIVNSIIAASLAAVAAVAAGIPLVLLGVRYRGRLVSFIDRAAYIGNALPGIVIALSLVFFGARHVPILYQTLPMLVFAYAIRFLPQSVGGMRASLLQVSPRLEEASHSLGSAGFATFIRVTLPLIAPGVMAGAALVFLTTMKELPITLLLRPTGFDTLVTEIWTAVDEGLFSQASPPALLVVLISALSITIILNQERRGYYG